MSTLQPNLPSVPSEDEILQEVLRNSSNTGYSYCPSRPGVISCSDNFKPASTTYVTALVDLVAYSNTGSEIERICQPLLTAKKGERIEVVDRYSPDIWVGVVDNRQGAFRLDTVRPVLGKQVLTLYPLTPIEGEGELAFAKGDTIEVVGPHEHWPWWFYGKLNGETGVVPFNFVEPINDPPTTEASFIDYLFTQPKALKVVALYDYQDSDPNDLSFTKGDTIIVLQKNESGWWDGQLGQRRGKFPKNYVTFSIAPQVVLVRPPWYPYYVRTIYSYKTTSNDELSFSPGEIIEVYDMTLAPWWSGRKRNGQTGLFPSNYITPVMDRRMSASCASEPTTHLDK